MYENAKPYFVMKMVWVLIVKNLLIFLLAFALVTGKVPKMLILIFVPISVCLSSVDKRRPNPNQGLLSRPEMQGEAEKRYTTPVVELIKEAARTHQNSH